MGGEQILGLVLKTSLALLLAKLETNIIILQREMFKRLEGTSFGPDM